MRGLKIRQCGVARRNDDGDARLRQRGAAEGVAVHEDAGRALAAHEQATGREALVHREGRAEPGGGGGEGAPAALLPLLPGAVVE